MDRRSCFVKCSWNAHIWRRDSTALLKYHCLSRFCRTGSTRVYMHASHFIEIAVLFWGGPSACIFRVCSWSRYFSRAAMSGGLHSSEGFTQAMHPPAKYDEIWYLRKIKHPCKYIYTHICIYMWVCVCVCVLNYFVFRCHETCFRTWRKLSMTKSSSQQTQMDLRSVYMSIVCLLVSLRSGGWFECLET